MLLMGVVGTQHRLEGEGCNKACLGYTIFLLKLAGNPHASCDL